MEMKWTELAINDLDFNRIAVDDNRARIKSDTVKLTPFQDDIGMDFDDVCDGEAPEFDLQAIQAIAALCSGLDFWEQSVSSDLIQIVINYITSQAITRDEQALGEFTCRKLKNMDTWKDWIAGEYIQLNQFHALQMFSKVISHLTKKSTMILRSH